MEFKLANCACASGWSCLMNLDLPLKFCLFLSYQGSFVGVSSCWPCSSKKELCTLWSRGAYVYQRLGKRLHPIQRIPTYFTCLSYFCIGYKLEVHCCKSWSAQAWKLLGNVHMCQSLCPSMYTLPVYKEWPSSATVYKECPSLCTCCVQIGHGLGHVYISKQFPSLGTL